MEYQITNQETDKKKIMAFLLRQFYSRSWCTGSGGGVSIKEIDEDKIWITPSGVHKDLVRPEDLLLIDLKGNVLFKGNEKLRTSECQPLFLNAYNLRKAGAVFHSHSMNAVLISYMFETEFQCIDLEMIKGIEGHQNTDWCVVPIIENTQFESALVESLKNAIITYPKASAVIVRNHGVYYWAKSWEKAKIHAEAYDYLFEAILKIKQYFPDKIKRTLQADPAIRAWRIDPAKEAEGNIKYTLQHKDPQWISAKELADLGVLHYKLDGKTELLELDRICKERNYINRDEKIIHKEIENYDQLCNTFFTEHLHYDEEIRYVLAGSGYFDIRGKDDAWIRIHVTKGDLIILPEGMYHRYINDESDYIHVMRLFQAEPNWVAYNRPHDESISRKKYIKSFIDLKA